MIQRIQTVYLLSICIVLLLMFFFPVANFMDGSGKSYGFFLRGLTYGQNSGLYLSLHSLIFLILISLILVLLILAIFTYKKRLQQIKITKINIVLLLIFQGIIIYFVREFSILFQAIINYSVIIAFPVISIILSILAMRAIKKDEELVRSMDRIR
jgi:hypothetical protein